MQITQNQYWTDYELIDTGNFEKLERFGKYIISRPEPQALWDKSLPESTWEDMLHAKFIRSKGISNQSADMTERGEWKLKPDMVQQWIINYTYKDLKIRFRLGLTAFKHLGIFPEQSENWNYIYNTIKLLPNKEPKILNLFAYTGGASLAARSAGADVYHVDSVKQVITWANENMNVSNLNDVRWIIEDVYKFVQREAKRGNKYDGIILDPPAYGRGPKGEKWLLHNNINELLKLCNTILEPSSGFLVLNLFSMGFSALVGESLVKSIFKNIGTMESGELCFSDSGNKKLPLGVFIRFLR